MTLTRFSAMLGLLVVFSGTSCVDRRLPVPEGTEFPPLADSVDATAEVPPGDTPADLPPDTVVDAVPDVHEDAAEDVPGDVLPDLPADAPADLPADAPADLPADAPADLPADAPADLPADVPADTPTDTLQDAPEDAPADLLPDQDTDAADIGSETACGAEGDPCDDGNVCTINDQCDAAGACKGEDNSSACIPPDANQCITYSCDPQTGCEGSESTSGCDDGNPITADDYCEEGACKSGVAQLSPCVQDAHCAVWDNDTLCDGYYTCVDGTCDILPETVVACVDAAPADCTLVACDPATGDCIDSTAGDSTPCDDGSACTSGDQCQGGTCAGSPVACDDGNPCTEDSCLPASGCSATPWKEEEPCGMAQVCIAGECTLDPAVGDIDHDGVCLGAVCKVNEADWCPSVWSPTNAASACQDVAPGLAHFRSVLLSDPSSPDAASVARRTHEPIEIPLANGIIDESVVGYWKLDAGLTADSSLHGFDGTPAKVTVTACAFEDGSGAASLPGTQGGISLGSDPMLRPSGSVTVMAWVKTTAGGQQVLFSNWWGANFKGVNLLSHAGCGHEGWGAANVPGGGRVGFVVGDDTPQCRGAWSTTGVADGKWHHVAGVFRSGTDSVVQIYVDGKLEDSWPAGFDLVEYGDNTCTGTLLGGPCTGEALHSLAGGLDDVVLFRRALAPAEVEAYYRSKAHFGTSLVPGAQADLDDVRVTETTPFQPQHRVPAEVLGPRPHSDSPCPAAFDGLSTDKIPHITDREDLCGVAAYWPLDGTASDLAGNHPGTNVGAAAVHGRNGAPAGALAFEGADVVTVPGMGDDPALQGESLTIEAWFLWSGSLAAGADEAFIVGKQQTEDSSAFSIFIGPGSTLTGKVATSGGAKSLSVPAATGRWVHVALTYDGATVALFLDGILRSSASLSGSLLSSGLPLLIGSWSGGADGFVGSIDEVVLHGTAKSPEYLYRRANPGVPMVRLLASTSPVQNAQGRFDWHSYELGWGDAAATQQLPLVTGLLPNTECYGLLSPCLGYGGWWRFNEGSGDLAVDSSVAKLNAVFHGTSPALAVPGQDRTAAQLDGASWYETPTPQGFLPAEVTIEAIAQVVHGYVVTKQMTPEDVCSSAHVPSQSYLMRLAAHFQAGVLNNASDNIGMCFGQLQGTEPAPGAWTHLSVIFDAESGKLLQDGQEYSIAVTGPPYWGAAPGPWIFGADRQWTPPHDMGWFLKGTLDSVRILSRALEPDELLHFPLAQWELGSIQ